jgi:hydroxyacylglutathione hydrolase
MQLLPLPVFTDNYIWLFHDGTRACAVDPGAAEPVLDWLQQRGLRLDTILLTHHHADHTGGVDLLRNRTGARVVGPVAETLPEPVERVSAPERLSVLGIDFQVLDVPGHTAGHIAYYTPDLADQPTLFCGDTLFSGGCGRLFEGTPAQMLDSLDQLAALPDPTRVCCAHEYTLSNLAFALAVEPSNATLTQHTEHCRHLRAKNHPTLPSTLALEKQINPFLRIRCPAVQTATRQHSPDAQTDVAVFAALRNWKNNFKG